jgi:hypothetical protein
MQKVTATYDALISQNPAQKAELEKYYKTALLENFICG